MTKEELIQKLSEIEWDDLNRRDGSPDQLYKQ